MRQSLSRATAVAQLYFFGGRELFDGGRTPIHKDLLRKNR
jgi:hypothetical protein